MSHSWNYIVCLAPSLVVERMKDMSFLMMGVFFEPSDIVVCLLSWLSWLAVNDMWELGGNGDMLYAPVYQWY